MPLEAEASRLMDPRTFTDLKQAALLRIRRYTQEWTDFNESDPGVTLVELFAWLTELMLFQMNRVPDLNYVRFLQLLGQELLPAQPSVAYLTFTPQPGTKPVSVAKNSQISAQGMDGESLIFETVEGLDVIPLPLETVQVFNGSYFEDMREANLASGTSFRPFGWTPQVGSALYLGFAQPAVWPFPKPRLFPQEISFRVYLPPEEQAGRPVVCQGVEAQPVPPVKLAWEYLVHDKPKRWCSLQTYEDQSAAFTREGTIKVEGPGDNIVTSKEGKAQDKDRLWVRVRVADRLYPAGRAPTIAFIRANVAKAENLVTVRQELLPQSDGMPNMLRTLRFSPVQPKSIDLRIREPGGLEDKWHWTEDLLRCGPDDPSYTLNASTGEIRFGDGLNGRIPVAGFQIMVHKYRYGGGAKGNVPIGAINAPRTPLTGVAEVKNERPATGGQDEQSYDDFKKVAPARLRCNNRAVSASDYESLARNAGGIARAKALPLTHPDYPGVEVPGAVTVVVVPDTEDIPPRPSQEQLDSLCRYLDQYRLLTTELHVRGPQYLEVEVEATVAVDPYAAFGDVARRVNQEINRYLDPCQKEGDDFGSDFGLDLVPTNLYSVIRRVSEVRQVSHLALRVSGQPYTDIDQPYTVQAYQMVYGVAEHNIVVVPYKDRT